MSEKIDEKDKGGKLTSQVKNQLKSTNQIKTNPIKNFSAKLINQKLRLLAFKIS